MDRPDHVDREENDDHVWISLDEIPGRTYARTIAEQLEAYATLIRAEPGR